MILLRNVYISSAHLETSCGKFNFKNKNFPPIGNVLKNIKYK